MYFKKFYIKTKEKIKQVYYFYKWFVEFFIHSPMFELYVLKMNKLNKTYFSTVKYDQANNIDSHLQSYYLSRIPKKLWIYWAQGEDTAPITVKKCIESWRTENPNWEIIVLNEENLEDFVELPSLPRYLPVRYQANLLRTKLLNKYGGVWTDATTYCHRPLSTWLPLLSNSGFFVFTNPTEDRDIENWFIASTKNHPLINFWDKYLENYYLKMKNIHPAYFLAFYIYQWMLKKNKNLRKIQRECSTLNAGPCFLMKSVILNHSPLSELEKHLSNGLPLSKLDWRLDISEKQIHDLIITKKDKSINQEV